MHSWLGERRTFLKTKPAKKIEKNKTDSQRVA